MKTFVITLFSIIMMSSVAFPQAGKENERNKSEQDAVSPVQLPSAVLASIEKEFPGFIIKTTRKFETSDVTGTPYFEVEVEKGKEYFVVQVDQNGKVLKKTALKAEAKQP